MAPFRLEYRRSVKKELRKLPRADRIAIVRKIMLLKTNPKPKGAAKLQGSRDLFRIRHGGYRVVYQIQGQVLVILIIRIGHRRDVYKNLL